MKAAHLQVWKRTKSFLFKPPGRWMHTATAVSVLTFLWGNRMPGGDLPFALTGLTLGVFLTATWMVRSCASAILLLMGRQACWSNWRTWCAWLATPVGLTIAILGVNSNLPFRMAFAVSRPALEREATKALHDGHGHDLTWVGAFPITDAMLPDDELVVIFGFDKKEFLWGHRGLVYCPSGASPTTSWRRIGSSARPIAPHWYVWHDGSW